MKATCVGCGQQIDLDDGNGQHDERGWWHEECYNADEENRENDKDR